MIKIIMPRVRTISRNGSTENDGPYTTLDCLQVSGMAYMLMLCITIDPDGRQCPPVCSWRRSLLHQQRHSHHHCQHRLSCCRTHGICSEQSHGCTEDHELQGNVCPFLTAFCARFGQDPGRQPAFACIYQIACTQATQQHQTRVRPIRQDAILHTVFVFVRLILNQRS